MMGKASRRKRGSGPLWTTVDDPGVIANIEIWCRAELGIGLDALAALGLAHPTPLGGHTVRYPVAQSDSLQGEIAASKMFILEVRRRAQQKALEAQAEENQAIRELDRLRSVAGVQL